MKIISKVAINASINIVFDLARSMDFHTYSVRNAGESIIDGRMTGLIGLDETVTFKGKHFGFNQIFKAKIIKFEYPNQFVDEMIIGSFKSFKHTHLFEYNNNLTVMTDEIIYKCPFGIIGNSFDWLFLNSYLNRIFMSRVQDIKKSCESNEWKKYL